MQMFNQNENILDLKSSIDRTEQAKKVFHATVPLRKERGDSRRGLM